MARNDDFDRRFSEAMKQMKKGAVKGLRLGAALVKRESQSRSPVDEGNLKGSHYVEVEVSNDEAVAEIGCTAEYAVYVHEILDNAHPVGEAKFLENAVEAKTPEVKALIKKMASV